MLLHVSHWAREGAKLAPDTHVSSQLVALCTSLCALAILEDFHKLVKSTAIDGRENHV